MLMVCGTALSKTKPYPGFIKYQQPSLWRRLGQTRSRRDMRDNIASKIGEHNFESMHYSRNNLLGLYSRMLKDEESAVEVAANLELELEELMYLSGSAKATKKLQKIYEEAQELLNEIRNKTEETAFFKPPAPPVDEKQKTLHCPVIIPEKERGESSETPSGNLETSEPQPSEDKQKTLNLRFDAQPDETPGKKVSLEKLSEKELPGDPKPAESTISSLPELLPEKKSLSGAAGEKTPSMSKKNDPAGSKSLKQKVDSDLSSACTQDNTGEVLKKAEPKSQKTLFDF